ncbi:MAG: 4Fe-4S dicluster domain-containing protein [Acidobacteriota bacterium]
MEIKKYKPKRRLFQFLSTVALFLIPFLNIVRLDIPTLRFYFFNSVLWIEEFYFLFLFLMLFTWVILTFSMIYGRVWCSWMCPQMTLIELTGWAKTRLKKLFFKRGNVKQPVFRVLLVHTILYLFTALLSILIGFNIVAYFVDPFRILSGISAGTPDGMAIGFITGIGLLILLDMIFLREEFCKKACPYGMLQMVITDNSTQIVRYHKERGNECIKCNACVKVCVMGIDIRKSPFQTECTHCGDCVDACGEVLSKLKPPRPTLITFSWGENLKKTSKNFFARIGLFDVKRWALVTLTFIFLGVLIVLSQVRQPLSVYVTGDRMTLYETGEAGEIINHFTLKLTNRDITDSRIKIICPDFLSCESGQKENIISLKTGETKKIKIRVISRNRKLNPGPNRVNITLQSLKGEKRVVEQEIVFFMPQGN